MESSPRIISEGFTQIHIKKRNLSLSIKTRITVVQQYSLIDYNGLLILLLLLFFFYCLLFENPIGYYSTI